MRTAKKPGTYREPEYFIRQWLEYLRATGDPNLIYSDAEIARLCGASVNQVFAFRSRDREKWGHGMRGSYPRKWPAKPSEHYLENT